MEKQPNQNQPTPPKPIEKGNNIPKHRNPPPMPKPKPKK